MLIFLHAQVQSQIVMMIFGNPTESLAQGTVSTCFQSDFFISASMTNIQASSQSHALRLAAWPLNEIPWFLLAKNTATYWNFLLNLRAKAFIFPFASQHRDQNILSSSPTSYKGTGFPQNLGLQDTFPERYSLKQSCLEATVDTATKSWHCQKIKVRLKSWHCYSFLFLNSHISSHSPYCSLDYEK